MIDVYIKYISHGGFRFVMGVPPVLIHILVGFSLEIVTVQLGIPRSWWCLMRRDEPGGQGMHRCGEAMPRCHKRMVGKSQNEGVDGDIIHKWRLQWENHRLMRALRDFVAFHLEHFYDLYALKWENHRTENFLATFLIFQRLREHGGTFPRSCGKHPLFSNKCNVDVALIHPTEIKYANFRK